MLGGFFVEVDLRPFHGGGSLALCHRGGRGVILILSAAVTRAAVMTLFPFPRFSI
jgi:hypothetical protein